MPCTTYVRCSDGLSSFHENTALSPLSARLRAHLAIAKSCRAHQNYFEERPRGRGSPESTSRRRPRRATDRYQRNSQKNESAGGKNLTTQSFPNGAAQTWMSQNRWRGFLSAAGFVVQACFGPVAREADDRPVQFVYSEPACPESAKWSGSIRPCRSPSRPAGRPSHALGWKAVPAHSAGRFPAGFGESSPFAPATRRLLALSCVHRRARRSVRPAGLRSESAPRGKTRRFSFPARRKRRVRLQNDLVPGGARLAFGMYPARGGQNRPAGVERRCLSEL